MAKVKFSNDNIEADVPVGESLKKVVEEKGANIHFACEDGRCGTCLIRITKGMENLNPKTENEKKTLELLGAEDDKRLACQCKVVKDGEIIVENVY